MKRNLLIGLGVVAALAAAYGAGRYAAPSKVITKIEEKVVWKEVKVEVEKKVEGPVRITKRTIKRPSPEKLGDPCPPIEETTTTEDRGETTTEIHTASDTTILTHFKKETLTKREYPRLTLGLGAASRIVDPLGLGYAGMVNYRFEGPFGVWAAGTNLSGGTVLVGLSVTF